MRWFIAGVVGILVFDAVMAWASLRFGFTYGEWLPGLIGAEAIVAAAAFMAAREQRSVRAGGLTGAGIGLVDAIVGWPLSGLIIPEYFPSGDFGDVVVTVIPVALTVGALGGVIGLLAGWLAVRLTPGSSVVAD
jgi:hypothetical protein